MPRVGLKTQAGVPVPEQAVRDMSARDLERLFKLPAPIVLAALGPKREPYTSTQVAVTQLSSRDVRREILKLRHPYWSAPMDWFWALMSTHGLHANLEGAAMEGHQEIRISETIDGIEVRGRVDDYTDNIVTDWKNTSAWSFKDIRALGLAEGRPDDLAQMQLYIGLLPLQGPKMMPTGARLVYVYRDWTPGGFARYKNAWSPQPIHVEDLSDAEADWNVCNKLLRERVATWRKAMETPDEDLPPCQDTYRPDKETGLPSRCLNYCPISEHCSQYQAARRAAGF